MMKNRMKMKGKPYGLKVILYRTIIDGDSCNDHNNGNKGESQSHVMKD